MRMPLLAGAFLPAFFYLLSGAATAEDTGQTPETTWIGQVSEQHCTPDHRALPGDDPRCITFMANDHQVYTIDNQDAVRPHIGHEVVITGTLNEELVIGISYESQGIIHADSVKMLQPMALSPDDMKQFSTLMKGMQPLVTAVRNVIVSKDKTPLAADSDKLSAPFQQVADFFKSHPSPGAEKFAETARDAARSIGTDSAQVEQVLALRKVTDTCAACHLAHRAGKQGSFQIQP